MRIGIYDISNDKLQWIVQEYAMLKKSDEDPTLVDKKVGNASYFSSLKGVAEKVKEDRIKRIWNQCGNIEEIEGMLSRTLNK